MKTIKKSLLLFAMVLAGGSVLASGDMNVNLIPVENNEALMAISSTVPNRFEVEIQNNNGDIIYKHKANSPSAKYEKVFEFEDLDNGPYLLMVKDNNEEIDRKFNLREGQIILQGEEKDMNPYFSFDNKNLKFSYLNFDQKDVHLYLYNNETGETIYQTDLGSGFSITSGLNLSKLKYGSYEVVLASEDHVHSYDLDIV
ncbi:MAG TPA: hypothetical protein PK335_12865 [Draconibacterium sp.]|nr:hypothetical protein [Draconibacterium sp.]